MTGWVAFLENAGCFLAAMVCFRVVWPDRSPFRVLAEVFGRIFRDGRIALGWGIYVAVIGIDILLTSVDHHITRWVGADFTGAIWRLEGDAVLAVQRCACAPLDLAATAAYMLLFPQAVILCLAAFTLEGDRPALRQFLAGFLANYAIALPFYLFFPVQEAWHFDERVTLRMDAVSPLLMPAYRPLSGIDNCFPSLHTSLALTAWLVALDRPRPRLAGLTGWIFGLTAVSTVYLGIHWATDVAAGALLGLLCHRISRRFSRDPAP